MIKTENIQPSTLSYTDFADIITIVVAKLIVKEMLLKCLKKKNDAKFSKNIDKRTQDMANFIISCCLSTRKREKF